MAKENKETELFTKALEQVRYEGQLLWQIFGAFLLPHSVFLAFILQNAFNGDALTLSRPGVFIASVVGFLLCIPWVASYSRSSDYYIFRMAQARAAEPPGWDLLHGAGEKFSAGNSVVIGGTHYRVKWLGRALRTKYSAPMLILIFALAYVAVAVISGPWWPPASTLVGK